VAGAQIIVLSEHVDYWNHLGWADPYSSRAFSVRQEMYARQFGLGGPYTPEMVVDGSTEFVGSDGPKAVSTIRAAAGGPKVAIRIHASEARDAMVVEVDPFPAVKHRKAGVYIAHAADSGSSDVRGGENRGRHLHHVSIAKDLRQVGSISERAGFQTRVPVSGGGRLIVFVQDGGNGRVWGAAMCAIP
jgi:hypothetical protein